MSSVNETIVREYFESLGFLVSQPCKYVVPGRRKTAAEEIDLLVLNPHAEQQGAAAPSLVWRTSDLGNVAVGLVAVRGWHTGRFAPSLFLQTPEILRFADDSVVRVAKKTLGTTSMTKILCLAELPASTDLKTKTLDMLKEKGVDGVLLFRTMLQHLVTHVDRNKHYEKSDLLQTVRILKSYGLFRDDQMDLFDKKRQRKVEN